jgi:hypothetical protein
MTDQRVSSFIEPAIGLGTSKGACFLYLITKKIRTETINNVKNPVNPQR